MKQPEFFNRYRFSEIRKDAWREMSGQLNKKEKKELRLRNFIYLLYRITKIVVLLPAIFFRALIGLFCILAEFEKLHFSPIRKITRGKDCVIDKQTWLVNGHNIVIGDFVKISAFSSIMAGNSSKIIIGDNTIIGPGVVIVSFNHGVENNDTPIRYQKWDESEKDTIRIGADVWIGANVVILPGAVIESGCVIGAGTIIKGNITKNTINYRAGGNLVSVLRRL